jgi:hypothetical protein
VPLRAVLPFSAPVLVTLTRSQREVGRCRSSRRLANLRIFADMPEQDDFIHTLCHLYFSFPSSASFPARSSSILASTGTRA